MSACSNLSSSDSLPLCSASSYPPPCTVAHPQVPVAGRGPALSHSGSEFVQSLQLALANGKDWWICGLIWSKRALHCSSLHARMDGEREAKQLLLSPLLVCLEKSRMCQNKYTIQCIGKSELLCTLSHVWPFGLRYLVCVVHLKLSFTSLTYAHLLSLCNSYFSKNRINLSIVSFVWQFAQLLKVHQPPGDTTWIIWVIGSLQHVIIINTAYLGTKYYAV